MDESKIPAWQRSHSRIDLESSEPTIDHARKFLSDDSVRNSSTEKKKEFLKSKGFDDSQIDKLLSEDDEERAESPEPSSEPPSELHQDAEPKAEVKIETKAKTETETQTETKNQSAAEEPSKTEDAPREIEIAPRGIETRREAFEPSQEIITQHTAPYPTTDAPPIITYPEFLTTSPRPPPLITPSSLTNILAVSGSIWAIMYGTARFVVSPMVEHLNDSRSDYYTHVNEKLGQLVEKLEGAVSEVPYKNKLLVKVRTDEDIDRDDESTFSDPIELFHRDIGTQTSPPPSTVASLSSDVNKKPVDAQADRLARLRLSLRELNLIYTRRADDTANLGATLREVREDVDKLTEPPEPDFKSVYGYPRTAEPNDEVKKTKDAIRSVKGMFLSSRSFPTAAATR
ncbi:hypothetical protein F4809DRAFT_366487 [Biscogniauxia mediterranea]|nr:hypothetical protein F4809DRAFT_366487 [Biscogniauxia mediterranea]